jgi:hypothetical protein
LPVTLSSLRNALSSSSALNDESLSSLTVRQHGSFQAGKMKLDICRMAPYIHCRLRHPTFQRIFGTAE